MLASFPLFFIFFLYFFIKRFVSYPSLGVFNLYITSFLLFLSTVFFYDDMGIYPMAVVYLFVVCFFISEFFFYNAFALILPTRHFQSVNLLNHSKIILFITSFVLLILYISIRSDFVFGQYRYIMVRDGYLEKDLLNSLSYSLAYAISFILGYYHQSARLTYRLLFLLFLTFLSLLYGSKLIVVISTIYFTAGIFASSLANKEKKINFNRRSFLAYISLLSVILIAGFYVRSFFMDLSSIGEFFDYILQSAPSYGLLSFPAFSSFITDYLSGETIDNFSLGEITFNGLFTLFGQESSPQISPPLFKEFVSSSGIETVIFTFYRTLVSEFGIFITFLLFAFFGFLSALFSYSITFFRGRISLFLACYSVLFVFIIYGVFMSTLLSRTHFVTLFIIWVYFIEFSSVRKLNN